MSQQELLTRVIGALDRVGIDYMLSGSIVSSLQGEPRSTHDIDIVVTIDRTSVAKLVEAFPVSDHYLDEKSIIEAIDTGTMFNLIDFSTGYKVDFWMLTDEPFDQSRFGRRRVAEAAGVRMLVSSPEDTILAKLRWARLSGGSEKQFRDALRVYEVQSANLDHDYLRAWAERLELSESLKKLIDEAESAQ